MRSASEENLRSSLRARRHLPTISPRPTVDAEVIAMGDRRGRAAGVLILLAVGWLIGLIGQRAIVEATGYMDVSPPLLLLAIVLCIGAGIASRLLVPYRTVRAGALAGVAMVAAVVVGYGALVFAYRDRFVGRDSGETLGSLLLESWFWVGIPIVIGALLGAGGWLVAGAVLRHEGRFGGGGPVGTR
jgi:hypothetical protein